MTDDIVTHLAAAIREAGPEHLEEVLRTFVEAAVPCQSCGADPRVCPASGEELPIVRGALDAQAAAEQRTTAAVLAEREACIAEIEFWWSTPRTHDELVPGALIATIRSGAHREGG